MTSAVDMKAARETYDGFLTVIKIAVPVVALLVAFVIAVIQ